LALSRQKAAIYGQQALDALAVFPSSSLQQHLANMVSFVIERDY